MHTSGGIGQPLSLLMKLSPYVSELSLYDIAGTPGVAADVSHINSKASVKGYAGEEELGAALDGRRRGHHPGRRARASPA